MKISIYECFKLKVESVKRNRPSSSKEVRQVPET